jgi:hypothetical protein
MMNEQTEIEQCDRIRGLEGLGVDLRGYEHHDQFFAYFPQPVSLFPGRPITRQFRAVVARRHTDAEGNWRVRDHTFGPAFTTVKKAQAYCQELYRTASE